MSSGAARGRLAEERKSWRKSHPHGFTAKPETTPDGSTNLLKWRCTIPGKLNTDWENGYYPITLQFNEDYPMKAPIVKFPINFFHPNVYKESGKVCLSILDEFGWSPSITVKQILIGVQTMLDQPNPHSPAQDNATYLFINKPNEYKKMVKDQAKLYPDPC